MTSTTDGHAADHPIVAIPDHVARWLEMHVCAVIVRDRNGNELRMYLERYGDTIVAALEDAMMEYPEPDDDDAD